MSDEDVERFNEDNGLNDNTMFSIHRNAAERRLQKREKMLDMRNALEDFTAKANEFVAATDPSTNNAISSTSPVARNKRPSRS